MNVQFSVHWSIFISTVGTLLMFHSLGYYERLLSKEALNVLSKLAFQAVCVGGGLLNHISEVDLKFMYNGNTSCNCTERTN